MCNWKLPYSFYTIIYKFPSPTCHCRQNTLINLLKGMGEGCLGGGYYYLFPIPLVYFYGNGMQGIENYI